MNPTHLLAEISPGGLVLDLQTGTFLELNSSATLIWRLHLAGLADDAITKEISRSFGIPIAQAGADVRRAIALPTWQTRPVYPEVFTYQAERDRYVFCQEGQALLAVDRAGQRLSVFEGLRMSVDRLRRLLQGLVPKLLALRGHTVLHAAAVAIGGRVVAFSGSSGAGKTTTAASLVRAGAKAISADKLILQPIGGERGGAPGPQVIVDGEHAVDSWSADAALVLVRDGWVPCETLDAVVRGREVAPLTEIGFLDVGRRREGAFAGHRLNRCAAAGAIFANSFHGSDSVVAWRDRLDQSCLVASATVSFELSVPAGLPALEEEARRLVAAGGLQPEDRVVDP